MRPILLPWNSVNHRAPSGPASLTMGGDEIPRNPPSESEASDPAACVFGEPESPIGTHGDIARQTVGVGHEVLGDGPGGGHTGDLVARILCKPQQQIGACNDDVRVAAWGGDQVLVG